MSAGVSQFGPHIDIAPQAFDYPYIVLNSNLLCFTVAIASVVLANSLSIYFNVHGPWP